jgi:DUF2934 family protein
MQNQERIRRRAHEIWEREGRPEGRHEEHWARASREVEAEGGAGPPPSAAPDDSPTPTAPDGGATPAQAAAAAAVGAPRTVEAGPPEPRPGAAEAPRASGWLQRTLFAPRRPAG